MDETTGPDPTADLSAREPILHLREFVDSAETFDAHTAPDFWEVGASGAAYDRETVRAQVLHRLDTQEQDDLVSQGWRTSDLRVRRLAGEVYLCTYTLDQAGRVSRRASIWERTDSGWRIVYHQGTLAPDAHADAHPEADAEPAGPRLEPLSEDWQRALVVVAHPDDIEYGTAAAVARWTQAGKTVTYLLATRGEAGIDGMHPDDAASVRAQEERDGAAEVGVDVVEFLEHTDGALEYGLALRRDIAREVRRRRPDVVIGLTHRERFAGGGTNQADHRAVGLALIDAARDAGNRWIFTDLLDEGLEPWSGVRLAALGASPQATHAIDVSDTLEAAVASLEAHAQYLAGLDDDYPTPRELLTGILREGAAATGWRGCEYAVTFEVYDL